MPRNLEPMLATPAKVPAARDDGGATRSSGTGSGPAPTSPTGGVRLAARRGTDHTPRYPELAAIADALGGREAILDGEIVAFDEAGRPSFQLLQRRMGLTDRGDDPPARGRDPGDLRRLRPALARRRARCSPSPTSAAASCSRASASTGRTGRRRRTTSATASGSGRRSGRRAGGDRRQAAAEPLPARAAQPRMAQGPQPPRPGAGDRRLDARRGLPRRAGRLAAGRPLGRDPGGGGAPRAPAAARLRRRGRHRLHPGDARPAARSCSSRCGATTRRSSSARTRSSSTASAPATAAPARSGSSRSSSASSSSPSGPARAPCASRRSRACATTRTRARSCARARNELAPRPRLRLAGVRGRACFLSRRPMRKEPVGSLR